MASQCQARLCLIVNAACRKCVTVLANCRQRKSCTACAATDNDSNSRTCLRAVSVLLMPPPLPHCHVCSDHWRKNTPVLGKKFRTYAIDLLGYGFSDKPNPRTAAPNSIYNFENWGDQLTDFIEEVIGEPTYISTNSVGGEAWG